MTAPTALRRRCGMTLVELLVALAIGAVVIATAMTVLVSVVRASHSTAQTTAENGRARLVEEQFLFDLRSIVSVEAMESNRISALVKDRSAAGAVRSISYFVDPDRGALVRRDNDSGLERVLAPEVASVKFTYYRRASILTEAARTTDINAIRVSVVPQARSSLLLGTSQTYVTTLIQLRNRS